MRVLFLDFDGVLHPGPDVASSLAHWCWLPLLTRLLATHADVRVVVHSTWRHDHDLDELRALLCGIGERVIAATERVGRLEGIERWLEAHPEVSSHRILDDDEGDFFYPLPAQLILFDSAQGISDERTQHQLRAWLAETTSERRN